MNLSFWTKRTLIVLAAVFSVLVLVGWLRQQSAEQFLGHAAIWAPISTTVYVVANVIRHLRGQRCELCEVPPAGDNRGAGKSDPRG